MLATADERSVAELQHETGLEASHLSQHLSVLRRHRLVDSERRASHVYYRLADPRVADLLTAARELLLGILAADGELLTDARALPSAARSSPRFARVTATVPQAISGPGWRRIAAYLRDLAPSRADYAGARRTWRGDLLAGLTVGIVALPLALGFGVSSGVGAEAGLVTTIVAGVLAAVFGGSRVQVSGPTGAMVVVLAPIVATQGVGSVAAVTLLAGGIVLVAGIWGWAA
ncbi:metalloregulator ArsR/SmtB family transcription factor, partial [Microbacterium aurum]